MTREEQIEFLRKRKISENWIAPPLHKALWKLGVEVDTPMFASFAENVIVFGPFFGILWGALQMLGAYLPWHGVVSWVLLPFSVIAGIVFGFGMALLFARQRRKYGLENLTHNTD